jgi:hypothetical protein
MLNSKNAHLVPTPDREMRISRVFFVLPGRSD